MISGLVGSFFMSLLFQKRIFSKQVFNDLDLLDLARNIFYFNKFLMDCTPRKDFITEKFLYFNRELFIEKFGATLQAVNFMEEYLNANIRENIWPSLQ